MNRARAAAAIVCLFTLGIMAGRRIMDAIKNNRTRFLTASRYALGLPERRRGPDRGEGARRVVTRRAGGSKFQPERSVRAARMEDRKSPEAP